MRLNDFFSFARERHRIHILRSRDVPQEDWTDDPVLRDFRFTNVFRELDRTTVWFRENVRHPLRANEDVLMATILFRWFNRIETGEALFTEPTSSVFNDGSAWDKFLALGDIDILRQAILKHRGDGPYVTAAYIIKTPDGMSKLDGVLWAFERCFNKRRELYTGMRGKTLQEAWEVLCKMPYMGPFMAYEVVTDLRFTHMLDHASDVFTWANPGPGCARGLSRLMSLDKDHFNRASQRDREEMMSLMQKILKASRDPEYWPKEWPRWEMRDVEHTLCEFDKYERARLGEGRPKQRFTFAP